jgi:hypothetical protein
MTSEHAANGNGSGYPRLADDHPLLEAMREASAHILAEEKHKFDRERAVIDAQVAATVAEVRAQIAELKCQLERAVAEKLAAVRDGEPGAPGATGPKGEPGTPGRDGRLRAVTDWSGGVHYAGDLITRDGSLWQCIEDTGHPPPSEDWVCLAQAGATAAH